MDEIELEAIRRFEYDIGIPFEDRHRKTFKFQSLVFCIAQERLWGAVKNELQESWIGRMVNYG